MTSIDYVFEQLEEQGIVFLTTKTNELSISISASDYLDIKRLAKGMHKFEIRDAFEKGEQEEYQNKYEIIDGERHYKYDNAENYYQETFKNK